MLELDYQTYLKLLANKIFKFCLMTLAIYVGFHMDKPTLNAENILKLMGDCEICCNKEQIVNREMMNDSKIKYAY